MYKFTFSNILNLFDNSFQQSLLHIRKYLLIITRDLSVESTVSVLFFCILYSLLHLKKRYNNELNISYEDFWLFIIRFIFFLFQIFPNNHTWQFIDLTLRPYSLKKILLWKPWIRSLLIKTRLSDKYTHKMFYTRIMNNVYKMSFFFFFIIIFYD